MKVAILGERSNQMDEGMKNLSIQLAKSLDSAQIESSLFDLRTISSVTFWRQISQFDPDILHLVPGPTFKGFVLLELLSNALRCQTVATATQPRFSDWSWSAAQYVRPDRLIVQSRDDELMFDSESFSTKFVPSGVSLNRFEPAENETKRDHREEFGIDPNERVFLHVGHFKESRNLRSLLALQEYGRVLIVGSPSTGPDHSLIADLRSAGCIVQTNYVPDIERYYQMADWYVFPVLDRSDSIQAPLSVLEAMACNLPVLSTRFGGLSDMFEEGNGLVFISEISEINAETLVNVGPIRTRKKVEEYSWESIGERITEVYTELWNEEH